MPLIAIIICGFLLGFLYEPVITAIVLACIWLALIAWQIRDRHNGTMP